MFEGLRDGRIGRFPIWVVAGILAAALVGFLLWRSRRSTADAPAGDMEGSTLYTDQGDSVDGLPPGSIGDFLGSNPLDPAYPVGMTPGGVPGPVTNVQWSRL